VRKTEGETQLVVVVCWCLLMQSVALLTKRLLGDDAAGDEAGLLVALVIKRLVCRRGGARRVDLNTTGCRSTRLASV